MNRSQNSSGLERLRNFIRDASLKMIKTYSRRQDFALEEIAKSSPVYGHWMSMILVSGKDLKITFKVHFMTKTARHLASPLYKIEVDKLSVDQAVDFMREYCNLMAGSVKKVLGTQKLEVGVSLPVVTRGFDEVFFTQSQALAGNSDLWCLKLASHQLVCSTVIEVYSKLNLSHLPDQFIENSNEQGDVEFL